MGLAWGNRRFPIRTGRACAAWPKDAGGVRLARIPPASVIAALARGSPNPLPPELSSPPRPGGRGRGLAGDELDAPSTQRREVRRPVVRSGAAKATVTRMGRDWPPDRTMRRAARWLGTRRRAAHLGAGTGRGKGSGRRPLAGRSLGRGPGRACPRATARGHERPGFAMKLPLLEEPRMILMHPIADDPLTKPAIDPVDGCRQFFPLVRLTRRQR